MGGLVNPKSPNGWTAWDYANHLCGLLQQIADAVQVDDESSTRRAKRTFVITLDANGNGSEFVKLQPGVSMDLLTYGYQVTPTASIPAGAYVAFYRDVEEGTGLMLVDDLTAIRSDSFNAQGHYVPEQSQLLVAVRGGPANGILSGNITSVQSTDKPGRPTQAGMS